MPEIVSLIKNSQPARGPARGGAVLGGRLRRGWDEPGNKEKEPRYG